MSDHIQSVIAFLGFFALCFFAAWIITPKKRRTGIKVGDCITPKHNWQSYDYEFTDIHSLASAVHRESRK